MLQDAYLFTFVQREQGDNEGIEYIDCIISNQQNRIYGIS